MDRAVPGSQGPVVSRQATRLLIQGLEVCSPLCTALHSSAREVQKDGQRTGISRNLERGSLAGTLPAHRMAEVERALRLALEL